MRHVEEMNKRIANGEFGNPVDMYKVNLAWAEILESVQGRQPTYNNISGLWAELDCPADSSVHVDTRTMLPDGSPNQTYGQEINTGL